MSHTNRWAVHVNPRSLRERASAHNRLAGINRRFDLRHLVGMMLYGPAHSESRLGSLESMILYWCHGSKDCGQISLSASDNDATPLLGNIGGKVEQRLYGLQEDLWVRFVTGQERNERSPPPGR